jgi:cysteinyl-tRNA synthetase
MDASKKKKAPKSSKAGTKKKVGAGAGAKKAPKIAKAEGGNLQWIRVETGGFHTAAVDRLVDDNAVEQLLNERTKAKATKDFIRADKIAALLQDMDVCYVDEQHTWYTREIGSQKKERSAAKRESDTPADGGRSAKKRK